MSQARFNRTARIAAAAAVLTLAASAPSFAAGEFLAVEAPSRSTPTESATVQPLTRGQVQEELRQARAAGTMSTNGELGDTDAVLAARESFNVAQAEAITALYAEQAAHEAALAQAEFDLQQARAQAEMQAMAPSPNPDNNMSLEFVGGDLE